jgi:hypothetical protein
VSLSTFIKAAALSACLIGANTQAAHARNLTPEERSVCAGLKACVDIIRRHDASEFDYDVLEVEFRRFGPQGKRALFTVLESDEGQADIADMIANLGPITAQDRQRIQAKWTQDRAEIYLPLLRDGHPMSRDLLLRSLGHPNADVREQVRTALRRLPPNARRAPISKAVQVPLTSALQQDPIAEAAPYLARLNPIGYEKQFAELLRSGDTQTVTAAYNALYRNNPGQAFNMLLAEMQGFETSMQARAAGQMLALRHRSRQDGFYLKFARDMSGDPKLSVSARASGLHGLLMIADGPVPELTPARAEALAFLVKGQGLAVETQYLPYLKAVKATGAMDQIWDIARTEKWINRDRIAEYYLDPRVKDTVTTALLQSDDLRTFSAGLRRAKPVHARFIRAKIDHPVRAIATLARQRLKLPPAKTQNRKCPIPEFDLDDMRAQMPFFESGWMITDNGTRVSLPRVALTTAHPSPNGWLAGYDLRKPGSRSLHSGGAILHYDNASGDFETVGNFSGPLAILPDRPLQLGQTTQQFWVVDQWGGRGADVSAYTVDMTGSKPRISHMGVLPKTATDFSVIPNGDLLITFEDGNQMPIRLSRPGKMSLACGLSQRPTTPRAPR